MTKKPMSYLDRTRHAAAQALLGPDYVFMGKGRYRSLNEFWRGASGQPLPAHNDWGGFTAAYQGLEDKMSRARAEAFNKGVSQGFQEALDHFDLDDPR